MSENEPLAKPTPASWPLVFFAWIVVLAPLLWGVWETLKKASALFR
jgi:hypothetical protein